MADREKRRNVLLYLAAEGVIPVLGGCAGALAGGPVGGIAGVAVGHVVEKAIDLFGRGIVDQWQGWFAKNPAAAQTAVAELASLSPAEARLEARRLIIELAPDATVVDLDLAVEFLSAIPKTVDRALVPDRNGGRSLPPTVTLNDSRSLLQLLPEDIPPYPASAELPGTPYRLVELIGAGGFGAVYRAVSPTLQHLPLAIKFCLDRGLLPALNQERSHLERLMRAGGAGARHVVRLYGYDLDHSTPYLVYEYVEGGDLTRLLASRRAELGGPPGAAEALGWILQLAEGLAFAHRAGLVHRDLKPANVLADGNTLKLADFGLGGVAAARAAARSRIGTTTLDYLSLADQASLFRGAGTPLYMSPEQRRGAPPDPRHDLYALGVVWYQLLTGDVSRELHHGWAKELAVRYGAPASHIALIERCVGWYDERPKDACEFLLLLEAEAGVAASVREPERRIEESVPRNSAAETILNASQVTPVPPSQSSGLRRLLLVSMVEKLEAAYARVARLEAANSLKSIAWGFPVALVAGWISGEFYYAKEHALDFSRTFPNAFAQVPFDAVAVLIGVLIGLIVWMCIPVIARLVKQILLQNARMHCDTISEELQTEFPAEVAAWGGSAVLGDRDLVRRIRGELSPRAPAPAKSNPSMEEVNADPTRRALLLARLREHARMLMETKEHSDLTWIWLALLWLFAAPLIGLACSGIPYLWDHGEHARATSFLIGLGGGLLAATAAWFLMASVRRNQMRKRESKIEGLAADYPRLVEAWGGRVVLESPEQVAALIRTMDPTASSPRPAFFRRLLGG